MAQLADNHALLIYRVGPVLCCAPTRPVETLIQLPPLTHPPGSSDSHPGIFRHDGKLVSLIEVRQLFGVEEQDRKRPGRIIICRLKDQHTGFLVDEIIDVIDTPASGWGQLPPSLSGGVFNRSLLLNDRIHLYTEFEKLQKVRNSGFLKPWIEQLQEKQQPHRAATTRAEIVDNASRQTKTATETTPASAPLSSTPLPTTSNRPLQETHTHTDTTGASASVDSSIPEHSQLPHSQPDHAQLERSEPDHHQPGAYKRPPARKNGTLLTDHPNETRHENSPVNKATQTATSAPATQAAAPVSTPQASPAPTSPHQPSGFIQTKAGTGLFPVAVFLISTGLIATLVYLWPDHSANPGRIPATRTPAITPQLEDPVAGKVYVSNQSTPSPILGKAPKQKQDEVGVPAPHDTSNDENRYHATIKHQTKEHGAREITIIITAPASDEVIRTDATSHEAYKQSVEARSSPATSGLAADKHEERQQKPVAPQRIDEVVHVVVRGDTLWHIARRYIHNPFRYPELARLNKIRNPDLIYPGNRVRIIRIYQHPAPASAD